MDKGSFLAEGTLDELILKHGEGEIIEISLDKNLPLSNETIKGIRKIQWEIPSQKGKIFVNNIAESLPDLINYISRQEGKILELGSRKMTLDDLFISMTGRHLHE